MSANEVIGYTLIIWAMGYFALRVVDHMRMYK